MSEATRGSRKGAPRSPLQVAFAALGWAGLGSALEGVSELAEHRVEGTKV